MHSGFFLTVEGIEGVGKTTAIKFISEYLSQRVKNLVLTREPGGTMIAEQIRQILLTPQVDEAIQPETELLLMFACRAQHIAHKIAPALKAGKWVVCDRFIDASFAYQGGGRQLPLNYLDTLESWIVGTYKPNLTILLDAPAEVGLMRAKNRGPQDRIEQEKIEFFQLVRAAYLARAKNETERFYVVDASQSLTDVHQNIQQLLDRLLAMQTIIGDKV